MNAYCYYAGQMLTKASEETRNGSAMERPPPPRRYAAAAQRHDRTATHRAVVG